MNTAQPIRTQEDLDNLKNYYKEVRPIPRNYLLIVVGLNTALRISDILELKWKDVYDEQRKDFREHICIVEHKTEKISQIYMNQTIITTLKEYRKYLLDNKKNLYGPEEYLFSRSTGVRPIRRTQAFRIIKEPAEYYAIPGIICCHSLRKTFGYYAWKQGIEPALLVNIFNHSSYEITKRYLGIDQDDKDKIFKEINL